MSQDYLRTHYWLCAMNDCEKRGEIRWNTKFRSQDFGRKRHIAKALVRSNEI